MHECYESKLDVKEKQNHIEVYNDLSVFYSYGLSKNVHANHCIKVLLGEDPLVVTYDREKIYSRGFIIKSDTSHKIKASDLVISIFIDPETDIGKAINKLFKRTKVLKLEEKTSVTLLNYFSTSLENHLTELEIKNTVLKSIFTTPIFETSSALDTRIEKVLFQIKTSENFDIEFNELLTICSLSESRLLHLFKKEIGITIRKYILWCRVQRAIKSITTGGSMKQAASSAGFTDAAHFNRTFVAMYGITPSSMLK